MEEYAELLEKYGWTIEHDSPLSVRNSQSGSYISGDYFYNLIHDLNDLEREENNKMITYRVHVRLRKHDTDHVISDEAVLVLTRGCDVDEIINMVYGADHDIVDTYKREVDNVYVGTEFIRVEVEKRIRSFK